MTRRYMHFLKYHSMQMCRYISAAGDADTLVQVYIRRRRPGVLTIGSRSRRLLVILATIAYCMET